MSMTGYTKLFGSILASTIWRESKETKILWITMLAMADQHGYVATSVPGLADMARLTVPETRQALQELMAPDPDSRTKEHEGRRIAEADGGFAILNHGKYRAKMSADDRREYLRIKQAEHRARKSKGNPVNNPVNNRQQKSTGSTHAEAEAEAEAVLLEKEPKEAVKPKSFDFDFEAAQKVQLDMLAPAEVAVLWEEYQRYRQRRHVAKGKEKLAWTEQAARMTAESINRAVMKFGDQIVSDRIRAAIAGSWQGLNFDKLDTPKNSPPPAHTHEVNRWAQDHLHPDDRTK